MTTTTEDRATPDYDAMTREQLYQEARRREIEGRSNLTREELVEVLVLDDRAPDAVDLVLQQHARIRELMDQFAERSSQPSMKKEQIVAELVTVLVKHARAEELVLYPAVRAELPELAEELDEGLEEHHLADLALAEIAGLSSDADRYDMKVHVMVEAMRHHLEEEEEDLLPRIRRGMDPRRLRELGLAMKEAWEVAPLLPHPAAPQTPPANLLAGALATVTDLFRAGATLVARRFRGDDRRRIDRD